MPIAPSTALRQRGIVVVLMSVVLLSSGTTIVKWAETSGSVVAAWRLVLASLAWWTVLSLRKWRRQRPYPAASTWRAAAPAGVFFGLDLALLFVAVNETSIAHAEFIGSLTPLLLVPIGMAVFGERPRPAALPFGVLTLVGLAAFLLNGPSSGVSSVRGDLIVLGSLAAWVSYLTFGRRARATVGVTEFMAVVMTVASFVAVPAALIMSRDEVWPVPARGWAAIGALTIITGMFGHALVAMAQRLLDVGTISVIQVLQPVVAVGWAWLVLGERLGAAQLPGMALIVCGLAGFVLVNRPRLRVAEAPPPVAEIDPAPPDPPGADRE